MTKGGVERLVLRRTMDELVECWTVLLTVLRTRWIRLEEKDKAEEGEEPSRPRE